MKAPLSVTVQSEVNTTTEEHPYQRSNDQGRYSPQNGGSARALARSQWRTHKPFMKQTPAARQESKYCEPCGEEAGPRLSRVH